MRAWLFLGILVFLLPRAVDLVSDPPADLGTSGGYYADEGFWVHNARNRIHFGTWTTDEWNNMYVSPLTHWMTYASFKSFGAGLRQARAVPVILGLLSLVFLGYGLPRDTYITGMVLYSFNVLLIHFGRLALLETPVIFFLIMSWFFLSDLKLRISSLVFAGFFMGCAIGTKLTVAYVIPAFFMTVLLQPGNRSGHKSAFYLLLGFVSACLLILLMIGTHLNFFLQYITFYGFQQYPWISRLPENLLNPDLVQRFSKIPVLMVCAFFCAGALAGYKRLEVPRSVISALLWFGIGILYINTLSYAPLRYYVPLVPPMIIMVAWTGTQLWKGKSVIGNIIPGTLFILVFLCPVLFNMVFSQYTVTGHWRWMILFMSFIIGACLIYAIFRSAPLITRNPYLTKTVLISVLCLHLVIQTYQFGSWFQNRTREIYMISRELGTRLENAVLTGQWSPVLCIENRNRAVPVWRGFVNSNEPFKRFGITHGLIWERHWQLFSEWFPEEFSRTDILEVYRIKNSQVILCRFNKPVLLKPGKPYPVK